MVGWATTLAVKMSSVGGVPFGQFLDEFVLRRCGIGRWYVESWCWRRVLVERGSSHATVRGEGM